MSSFEYRVSQPFHDARTHRVLDRLRLDGGCRHTPIAQYTGNFFRGFSRRVFLGSLLFSDPPGNESTDEHEDDQGGGRPEYASKPP